MAKILISPLGTGGQLNENAERKYQQTTYKIDNIDYHDSKFVSSVLYKHFNLDGIIFIGTVKSMWELVYDFFCQEKGIQKDDEYWHHLARQIEHCNYQSPLTALDLFPLQQVLGEHSQCILINYGLTESEIWSNFDHIIQVINTLQDNDEIYIDITHAFRSLSVLQFLSIIFIKDLLVSKHIHLKGIYYGMFEVARSTELNYAPIIDLMPFFEMINWMQGAYAMKNFGNGYLIADLLARQNQQNLARSIKLLSEAININYVPTIQERANHLKSNLENAQNTSPFKYTKHILESFVSQFSDSSEKASILQLNLARWYFENKHYATGYITLAESIVTYICEINNKDWQNKDEREKMKNWLNNKRTKELTMLFKKINPIRNAIAHASFDKKSQGYLEAINNALNYCEQIQKIYQSGKLS